MTEKILVFIPAYNCENQIRRVLSKLTTPITGYIDGIIITDNSSLDETANAAIAKAKEISGVKVAVLQNDNNYGYGGSVKVAINHAIQNGYSYLLVLHGDDQADIADFFTILKTKSYQKNDFTMGARFHPDSKLSGYSKFLTFCNRALNFFCSLTAGYKIYDLGSGLNIYKLSAVSSLPYKDFPDDLTFDSHLISEAIRKNLKIIYSPISWRSYDQVSNAKAFRQGIKIVFLFLTRRLCKPNLSQKENKYSYKIIFEKNAD